eukprot:SAG31_NODE_36903_length_309_cov_0.742857_1_plen_63_part_10
MDLVNSSDPAAIQAANELGAKLVEGRKHLFAPDRGAQDPASCVAAVEVRRLVGTVAGVTVTNL